MGPKYTHDLHFKCFNLEEQIVLNLDVFLSISLLGNFSISHN